jgi:GAF domain-containing protein
VVLSFSRRETKGEEAMAHAIAISPGATREQAYQSLLPQVAALVEDEADLIANLANVSAALKQTFEFLWVGFYRMIAGELVLGPFQGPIACTRINLDRGACGAAARERRTIIVPDVDQFPGHIACSSLSRSEIVVPLIAGDQVALVLDVDSEQLNDFSTTDEQYLGQVVGLLKARHFV